MCLADKAQSPRVSQPHLAAAVVELDLDAAVRKAYKAHICQYIPPSEHAEREVHEQTRSFRMVSEKSLCVGWRECLAPVRQHHFIYLSNTMQALLRRLQVCERNMLSPAGWSDTPADGIEDAFWRAH